MGGWTFALPSLPFLSRPFLPVPSIPSLPFPSLPFPSLPLEVGPLNPARGSGERCMLPQRGLGQSPSRNRIWCFLAIKSDIWYVATIGMIFLRINCLAWSSYSSQFSLISYKKQGGSAEGLQSTPHAHYGTSGWGVGYFVKGVEPPLTFRQIQPCAQVCQQDTNPPYGRFTSWGGGGYCLWLTFLGSCIIIYY